MPALPLDKTLAPRFELPIHGGGTWSLDDAIAESDDRPIVLVFHRHIH